MDQIEKVKQNPIVLVEMTVVLLFISLTGIWIVGPVLADTHPMFEEQLASGEFSNRRDLPETPRGWAITAYGIAILVGYTKLRERVIGPFDESEWSTGTVGLIGIMAAIVLLTIVVFGSVLLVL